MSELNKISDTERFLYELIEINKQFSKLLDSFVFKLRDQHPHKSKTEGMIDPRTGKKFRGAGKDKAMKK